MKQNPRAGDRGLCVISSRRKAPTLKRKGRARLQAQMFQGHLPFKAF